MKKQVPKLQPRIINAPLDLQKIKDKKTKSTTCCWCIFYLFSYFSPVIMELLQKLFSWWVNYIYTYSLFIGLNNHFINNLSFDMLNWMIVVHLVKTFLLKFAQGAHVIRFYIVLSWTWIFRFFKKCSTICLRTKNW